MYCASCSPANLIKPDKLSFLSLLDFCYFEVLGIREGVAIFLPFCGTFAQDGVVEMNRPCQWNAGAGVYHLLKADCQMFQTSQYLVVKHSHYLTLRFQFSCVRLFAIPWTARLPCPSPTPGVYSNSCPSSWWCRPTISSSVILFSSCLQSFPASGSFSMSQLITSGHQSIDFQLQHHSFQWIIRTNLLYGLPCWLRG